MQIVFLTALGVGGATIFGSVIGFLFQAISQRFTDIVLAFAAGVMLAATVLGLILPAIDYGGVGITILGIFLGAFSLNRMDHLVPHLHALVGVTGEGSANLNKVLLFVSAIAIHNLPEGIAAGVSFGTESTTQAILIAGGIALQNIPEGMVIIAPMLAAGIHPKRTFLCGLATGLVEVIGTLLGYFAVTVASALLPLALAFAGGTMLYVIGDEMIPETHHENESSPTYALLTGFCLILLSNSFLC